MLLRSMVWDAKHNGGLTVWHSRNTCKVQSIAGTTCRMQNMIGHEYDTSDNRNRWNVQLRLLRAMDGAIFGLQDAMCLPRNWNSKCSNKQLKSPLQGTDCRMIQDQPFTPQQASSPRLFIAFWGRMLYRTLPAIIQIFTTYCACNSK